MSKIEVGNRVYDCLILERRVKHHFGKDVLRPDGDGVIAYVPELDLIEFGFQEKAMIMPYAYMRGLYMVLVIVP